MNKNSNSGTGAFLVFAGIAAVLFGITYFCDIDRLSKSIDRWFDHLCKAKDPMSFITLVIAAVILAGLLMAIEYRPRK
jgi:Kef-type K+ transport system membrane component KefB